MRVMLSPDDVEKIEVENGKIDIESTYVYSQIITGIISGQHLILHRPSFAKLCAAYEANKVIISPNNLLALINEGHVSVAAREPWFEKSYRGNDRIWGRNYKWEKWDDELVKMLKEDDSKKELKEKRVFFLTGENGSRMAEGKVYSEEIMEANPALVEYARTLLQNRTLPAGLLERALKPDTVEKGEREQIRVVIQDARNNSNLLVETESDIPFRPGDYFDGIEALAQRGRTKIPVPTGDGDNFEQMIHLLASLRKFRTFDEFDGFLRRNDRKVVADGVQELLARQNSIQVLIDRVESQREKLRNKKIEPSEILLGFVRALWAWKTGDLTGAVTKLVESNIGNLKTLLAKAGISRLDAPGLEWISMLVFADRNMNTIELDRLSHLLRDSHPDAYQAYAKARKQ